MSESHEIILHQYELSPFSEKIRTTFGFKGLAWQAVEVAPLPPRPLLTPLAGGYRRVPVMQIGADIYCDSNLILPTLDRLHPSPSLYPAGSEGLAQGLGFAWERQMWIPTIGVLVHYIGDHLPEEFLKDRKEGYLGIDISKSAMAPDFDQHTQFLRAQLAWLIQALTDRPFLFGHAPSAADLACWQTIFLLRKNSPPDVDALLGLEPLVPWYDSIVALGHGQRTDISDEHAFEVARAATPAPTDYIKNSGEFSPGATVTVTPDDNARVPVTGTLMAADAREIVLRINDTRAGELNVHFPRIGFNVTS